MTKPNNNQPGGRHYVDPEILPPEPSGGRQTNRPSWERVFIDERGTHRVYVTKVGPLGLFTFSLMAGLVSIALLIFFLGAFVILLPVVGLLLAAAAFAGVMRAFARRSD